MAVLDLTETVTALERDLALSDKDLAQALDIDVRTWRRWKTEGAVPQRDARERLDALVQFREMLLTVFTPEDARTWMHGESPYLGKLKPADAIRAGRLDRVVAALDALDSGVFT